MEIGRLQIDEAALQDFEKETGIKVNIVEGADADGIESRSSRRKECTL